ncbi:MAG: hypothetical protein IJ027_06600 [Oscillospiraceae bacterium]|nr:hypothetical protein [Oscillospiraceae bacterium]
MKKIISLIIVAVFSITALCIPSFAYSQNFRNYFKLDYMSIGSLPSSDYYYVIPEDYNDIHVYPKQEDAPFGAFSFVHVYFDYDGSQQIKAGDRLVCSFDFTVADFSTVDNPKHSTAFASIQAKYNGNKFQKVGTCDLIHSGYDYTQGTNIYRFLVNIDFYAPENIETLYFSFGVNFNGFEPVTSHVLSATFNTVENFYLGSADSPEAPKYDSNTETIGKTDDLKNQEDKLMQDTEQGRESTLSLFAGLADLITELSVPLMAISALFNYFVGNSILNSVLQISLTLGLLAFVFNLGQSLISRSNNQRGQKQNNKKGGG